jgi:hypothetical protein
MSKPRLPTLKLIAGERPRCQYCGKALKPLTCTVEVASHVKEPPTIDELLQMPQPGPSCTMTELAATRGNPPERVFRMTHEVD